MKLFLFLLILCSLFNVNNSFILNAQTVSEIKSKDSFWEDNFELVTIKSSIDGKNQKAYFYKTKSNVKQPLIVSLHTWSGSYTQKDPIAILCKKININYIHPNFRGPNKTKNACCSNLALNDIDESISYAIKNANIDTSKIYVIGESGGGFATISTFMKSVHKIKKFSAWVPISDLIAWYNECRIRENRYADQILACTNSIDNKLNETVAKEKSPIYWGTPIEKLSTAKLNIYTGIYDGIQGSVPITHSINFYNKVLADLSIKDSAKYVSDKEKLHLLEKRTPLANYSNIAGRKVFLKKECNNVKLVIFEGGHEMLAEYAFTELVK